MTVRLTWYGRYDDMTPNYNEEHHGTVIGSSADDCMKQITELRNNNDISKYTPIQIESFWD